MNYIVYICNHCTGCAKVIEYMKSEDINCRVVNVDTDNEAPPIDLMIFPALLSNDKLMAYGEDIMGYLKNI